MNAKCQVSTGCPEACSSPDGRILRGCAGVHRKEEDREPQEDAHDGQSKEGEAPARDEAQGGPGQESGKHTTHNRACRHELETDG